MLVKPVIPAIGKFRQEDHEFKASLCCHTKNKKPRSWVLTRLCQWKLLIGDKKAGRTNKSSGSVVAIRTSRSASNSAAVVRSPVLPNSSNNEHRILFAYLFFRWGLAMLPRQTHELK
jgi:hypothetical protein